MDSHSLEEQFDMGFRMLKLDLKDMEQSVQNQIIASVDLAEKMNIEISDIFQQKNLKQSL
jgi:hypothetical protein